MPGIMTSSTTRSGCSTRIFSSARSPPSLVSTLSSPSRLSDISHDLADVGVVVHVQQGLERLARSAGIGVAIDGDAVAAVVLAGVQTVVGAPQQLLDGRGVAIARTPTGW